jgi:hypothetical protein
LWRRSTTTTADPHWLAELTPQTPTNAWNETMGPELTAARAFAMA